MVPNNRFLEIWPRLFSQTELVLYASLTPPSLKVGVYLRGNGQISRLGDFAIAHLVEQLTHNQSEAGSIPASNYPSTVAISPERAHQALASWE